MDEETIRALEETGFQVGTVKEFLGLSDDEERIIERRIAAMKRVGPTDSDARTEVAAGLYAVLAINPNGGEDIVGFHSPTDGWMPLVCTDQNDPAMFDRAAREIARTTGRTLRLVHFGRRTVVKEIKP